MYIDFSLKQIAFFCVGRFQRWHNSIVAAAPTTNLCFWHAFIFFVGRYTTINLLCFESEVKWIICLRFISFSCVRKLLFSQWFNFQRVYFNVRKESERIRYTPCGGISEMSIFLSMFIHSTNNCLHISTHIYFSNDESILSDINKL